MLIGALSLLRVVALTIHEEFTKRFRAALEERDEKQVGSELPQSGMRRYILAWAPWLSQIPKYSGQPASSGNGTTPFKTEDHGKVEAGHNVEELSQPRPETPQSPNLAKKDFE